MDTDYAAATSGSLNSDYQQAGTAMLAQANQFTNGTGIASVKTCRPGSHEKRPFLLEMAVFLAGSQTPPTTSVTIESLSGISMLATGRSLPLMSNIFKFVAYPHRQKNL